MVPAEAALAAAGRGRGTLRAVAAGGGRVAAPAPGQRRLRLPLLGGVVGTAAAPPLRDAEGRGFLAETGVGLCVRWCDGMHTCERWGAPEPWAQVGSPALCGPAQAQRWLRQ